jgi:hypothetical protein
MQRASRSIRQAREKTLKQAVDEEKRVSRILPRHRPVRPQFRDHDLRSFPATSADEVFYDKEDVSAEHPAPEKKAWVSVSDEDPRRPGDPQGASR